MNPIRRLEWFFAVGLLFSCCLSAWAQPQATDDQGPSQPPAAEAESEPQAKRSPPETPRDHPAAVVLEPSQGRPIFITPGESIYLVMRMTDAIRGDVAFFLRHAREPGVQWPLKPTTPPSYPSGYCTMVLEAPADTAPGLYDVEVRASGGSHFARRSVQVVDEFKDSFRFVHLSGMHIGDPTATDFDDVLPREINLLAPEFIIATGDYTEWARARDDAASWLRVLAFFEKFDAPVFMLCGAHDHEASFRWLVGNRVVDKFDYGAYRGFLLLDHPGNPIEQDYAQIEWLEGELKRSRDKRFNFIAANSDELGLLDVWREKGDAADFLKENRIRMFLCGGATDWDYREFAEKLRGLDGVHYVRTHLASTAQRDRATGVSHYRVIEVSGDDVSYTYPDDNACENLQHSIAAGRLRVFYDGPNDGSRDRVVATVQNALNQPFANARLWLRVAKRSGDRPPAVSAPGRLIRALDAGAHWGCEVAVDLPDKGAVRVMAAANQADIPPPLPIAVQLSGSREWDFEERSTDFGLTYYSSRAEAVLAVTNNAQSEITCWPVIRINGNQLYADPKACPRLPLVLPPGKTVSIPLVLDVRKVSPGPHLLQVYFLEDPLIRTQTEQIELSLRRGVARR